MNKQNAYLLDRKALIANFNKAAVTYNQVSVLQKEIADRLFDRLDLITTQPQTIIDIGARTGYTTQLLQNRYPEAKIIAIECAESLLRQVNSKKTPPSTLICAAHDQIPLSEQCADLIIANLAWHWLDEPWLRLAEWRRLLKPTGLILLTTCGPNTYQELRASFAAADTYEHLHQFMDMHDIGDALMAAQFAEPIMQTEHLYLQYSCPQSIFRDLRDAGIKNALQHRRRSLTGKNRWRRMLFEYEKFSDSENGWPVTIEVIYGLAWAGTAKEPSAQEEVVVPINQIGRKNYGQN